MRGKIMVKFELIFMKSDKIQIKINRIKNSTWNKTFQATKSRFNNKLDIFIVESHNTHVNNRYLKYFVGMFVLLEFGVCPNGAPHL